MIRSRDVVRMKVPYPSVNSKLAAAAHMYICKKKENHLYEFIKCQTLKPYMFSGNQIVHYCDEMPDILRNPFQRTTRIDCDKLFITQTVEYADGLKTTSRPDVCDDLFRAVLQELDLGDYLEVMVNEMELCVLNSLITLWND